MWYKTTVVSKKLKSNYMNDTDNFTADKSTVRGCFQCIYKQIAILSYSIMHDIGKVGREDSSKSRLPLSSVLHNHLDMTANTAVSSLGAVISSSVPNLFLFLDHFLIAV